MSELITRENAKKAICECCYLFKYFGDSYTECRYYPCDDIKALEAIPEAPKMVDSKEPKINHESTTARPTDIANAYTNGFVEGAVNEALKRPTGEWEDKEIFNNTNDDHIVDEWQSARCSVCGKYHTTPYMYYFDNFNFCPNCGADMRGGEDEC